MAIEVGVQSTWPRVRHDKKETEVYDRIVKKSPQAKKKARGDQIIVIKGGAPRLAGVEILRMHI